MENNQGKNNPWLSIDFDDCWLVAFLILMGKMFHNRGAVGQSQRKLYPQHILWERNNKQMIKVNVPLNEQGLTYLDKPILNNLCKTVALNNTDLLLPFSYDFSYVSRSLL